MAALAAGSEVLGETLIDKGRSDAGDLTQFVNIAIGTGGHGHTFPGATVPFGAVQVSPDTWNRLWDWSSGYHLSDDSIMGFSHTHLSGTGVGDMLDVLLVPRTGPLYAVKPASGTYVFGSPLFDRARVRVSGNRDLVIETKRSSPAEVYVQSVTFNGQPYERMWVHHDQIAHGAHLVFTMGVTPNMELGQDERFAPVLGDGPGATRL